MVASQLYTSSLRHTLRVHNFNVHHLDARKLSGIRAPQKAVAHECWSTYTTPVRLSITRNNAASRSKFSGRSREAPQLTKEQRKFMRFRELQGGSALQAVRTEPLVREDATSKDLDENVTQEEEHFHKLTHRSNSYWADVMQRMNQQESAQPSSSRQENEAEPKRSSKGSAVRVEQSRRDSSVKDEPSRTQVHDRSAESRGTQPAELSAEMRISLKQLLQFERKGHVCLRGLVQENMMEEYAEQIWAAAKEQELDAYRHRVAVLCPEYDAASISSIEQALDVLERHSSEELGFLQMFNLHRYSRAVRELVTSPRLAKLAAELLNAPKVRLYQDCLFLKHPGFGATNWHSDLNMVPLDTNSFVTFWIPLRSMDEDDSGLLFASGSHRDFALPYWQNLEGMDDLEKREYELEGYGALELGDATCHHGWCLHYAMPQPEDSEPRAALSISYFADGAKVLNTQQARRSPHDEDAWSFREWRQALQEDDAARHELLPVVYPASQQQPRSKKTKHL